MKLELKKVTKNEDFKEWVSWLNNKSSSKFTNRLFQKHTIKSQKNFLHTKLKSKKSILYKIIYENLFVGVIEADDINYLHSHCDIGFLINPKYQRKGIITSSLKLLIPILRQKKMRILYGRCFSKNIASSKVFFEK